MTAIQSETKFGQDFAELVDAVKASGNHALIFVDEFEHRIGTGPQTVVICKNLETGKGWGILWRVESGRLEGMHGRIFRADNPDSRSSRAFMETFRKRLRREAASLADVTHSVPNSFRFAGSRHLKSAVARRCY